MRTAIENGFADYCWICDRSRFDEALSLIGGYFLLRGFYAATVGVLGDDATTGLILFFLCLVKLRADRLSKVL